jgi:prepilin-type processing-associated H-X9-DG protein
MFRALRPGGGIRVGGPDVGAACAKLIAGDRDWFSTYPVERKSVGGRFANFVFCDGEHLTALSESYLRELAEEAGFVAVKRMLPCRESDLVGREVLDLEYESDFDHPHTVIIEARKPA